MLHAQSLSFTYPDSLTLGPLDFTLQAGDWTAVLGPNGAGKSTLLGLLSGRLKPATGNVTWLGKDLAEMKATERARLIAVVPQRLLMAFDLTVTEMVELGRLAYMGLGERMGPLRGDHRLRVEESLVLTDSWSLRKRRFRELSGGEQQRVLLAQALAQDTPCLLLDEPTASLDPGHTRTFLDLVQELANEKRAVLMAHHELSLVGQYCRSVLVLKAGQVAATGTTGDVLNAALLSEVYGTKLDIIAHPDTGRPLVIHRSAR